jgi:sugar porter (SP) family MFS transporter
MVGYSAKTSGTVPQGKMKSSFYGYLIAFSAAMGGLLFGYEIGVVSQTLEMNGFKRFFGMVEQNVTTGLIQKVELVDDDVRRFTTFTFLAGCFLGAAFVSWLADFLGRKKSIIFGGFLFIIGGVLQTVCDGLAVFYAGRVIAGLGIGILSMCSPLYISEAAPREIRGRMLTVQQLMITIGILIASIVNSVIIIVTEKDLAKPFTSWDLLVKYEPGFTLQWRLAMGIQCAPAVLLMIVMFFMPESPRWLALKGRGSEALKVIAKLRSEKPTEEGPLSEFKDISDSIAHEKTIGNGSWGELLTPGIRNRLVIAVLLQTFQQWTGINVILYYQGSLIQGMGFDKDQAQIPFTIANNFINFVATFPGMYLIERLGRRKLLIFGGFLMGLAHFLVSIFVGQQLATGQQAFAWASIFSVYLFFFAFASTWGPVVWAYQSEIFPLRLASKGTGVATMTNWGMNAVIGALGPSIQKLGASMYLIFGVAGVTMGGFSYFFVPETMGYSLEEMDKVFGYKAPNDVEEN